MIKGQTLLDHDFIKGDCGDEYFYYWDYAFYTSTQELYDINDGFGEPMFIAKIDNLEHLKDVMWFYGKVELELINDKK